MLTLKTLDIQDNGKLMIWLSIVAIITANIFLGVLALTFKDGIANEAASLYQQEITILIPTSGLVALVQHGISTFFASKQVQQAAQQAISNVSRETPPSAS
jgi:uncharacterized membrane protein